MANNYEEEIKQLVGEIIEIPPEKIDPQADFFNDLGVDSLKAIEIVAAFEKKYRIIIPERDIPKVRNLSQIVEYTKNLKQD
jgi:acyl carrier protein